MSLTHAPAPEGIGLTLGKYGRCIDPAQRKQTRIPACGDQRNVSIRFRRLIHCLEVCGNMSMMIKAVDDIKISRKCRCHFRKICRRTAADHHDVDIIFIVQNGLSLINRDPCAGRHVAWISPCKNANDIHIWILLCCCFYSSSEITISVNCYIHSCLLFISVSDACSTISRLMISSRFQLQ